MDSRHFHSDRIHSDRHESSDSNHGAGSGVIVPPESPQNIDSNVQEMPTDRVSGLNGQGVPAHWEEAETCCEDNSSEAPIDSGERKSARHAWLAEAGQTVFSIVVLGIGVLVFMGLSAGQSQPQAKEKNAVKAVVEVTTASTFSEQLDLESTGVAVPAKQMDVIAEVSGKVVSLSENCRVGRPFRAGETIAEIDPIEYEIEIRRLQGLLQQSQASLSETETEIRSFDRKLKLAGKDLELREAELKRNEQLKNGNAISKSELNTAALAVVNSQQSLASIEDSLSTLNARVSTLESAIAVAQQQLARAELDLKRTVITAPFDGVVVTEALELGLVLQKGQAVISLQDATAIEILCNLEMKQLQWIWQDEVNRSATAARQFAIQSVPVTIKYQLDGLNWHWSGKLDSLDGGSIDQQTRLAPCRVLVTDRVASGGEDGNSAGKPALLAGMFVSLELHIQPRHDLIEIPAGAVQPGGFVWAVRDAKLAKVPLRIAHTTDSQVLVFASEASDLHHGDQVVVSPIASPMEGLPVSFRETL